LERDITGESDRMEASANFLSTWSGDLQVKGFREVRTVQCPVPHIEAFRRDGKRFFGFAVMDKGDLNEQLHLLIRGKSQNGTVIFLQASFDMLDDVERKLKCWELHDKVYLEGFF
jgi:hypothetical protein